MKIVARSPKITIIMEINLPSEAGTSQGHHWGNAVSCFLQFKGLLMMGEVGGAEEEVNNRCVGSQTFALFFPDLPRALIGAELGFQGTEPCKIVCKLFVQMCLSFFSGKMYS